MPVILSSEAGGTMIHEAVGHGLEADLAEEGLSVYSGKIGEKIASERYNRNRRRYYSPIKAWFILLRR